MQVNGWELFAHSLLLDQLEKLITAVDKGKAKKPNDYHGTANFKLLAALFELMFNAIPADPTRPEYRQGATLGENYKHWFRAKFGAQRFRLFFRYDSRAKVIVYAWVNDSDSLRTYGSKTARSMPRGRPGPVSSTSTRTRSFAGRVARTVTRRTSPSPR